MFPNKHHTKSQASSDARNRLAIGILVAFAAGLLAGILLRGVFSAEAGTTLVSLAPNDQVRVRLVELPNRMDRNFQVHVETIDPAQSTVVFTSPDEGKPIGSERIVWSADSSRFLLLGRHFFVAEESRTPQGEALYLMYDLRSGLIWCNASQQDRLPKFGPSEVAEVEWIRDPLS